MVRLLLIGLLKFSMLQSTTGAVVLLRIRFSRNEFVVRIRLSLLVDLMLVPLLSVGIAEHSGVGLGSRRLAVVVVISIALLNLSQTLIFSCLAIVEELVVLLEEAVGIRALRLLGAMVIVDSVG